MGTDFDSASGLRPASAFVMIASALALVGVWVSRTVMAGETERSPWTRAESAPEPEYSIHDREGRTLALFVQRLDLVMSPNSMWQGHTPARMAEAIGATLGVPPRQLLDAMLPDARDGVVEVDIDLDESQAQRAQRWLEQGSLDGAGPARPVAGVWVGWSAQRSAFRLHWVPESTLSPAARAPFGCADSPLRWGRFLADGLAACIQGAAFDTGLSTRDLELRRQAVWDLLMPSTYTEVVRDFPAECGPALLALLDREGVAHHQMSVERGREREYPAGALALLGGWGYLDEVQGESLVLEQRGFPSSSPGSFERYRAMLHEDERRRLDGELREVLARPHPLFGLERACDQLLEGQGWNDFLEHRAASYSFLRQRPVRQRARSYYLESVPASESPRVLTTLDLSLQRFVGRVLDGLMETNQPALAMAVVVELQSGDVLAIDSRQAYDYSAFAPLYHEFTPGSTFKPVVMASALEAGQVRPSDTFDVGTARAYPIGGGRIIREAESSRTGILTAAECLAYSVNAGLVQIGLRVSSQTLRRDFQRLGYGSEPGTGLGGERDGYLAKLPWSETQTKASLCFGHELSVTLWQHAAALATILRGGEALPLRMIGSVEQNGVGYQLEPERGERVFGEATCRDVREMMKMGAREGTGSRVASPEVLPGLVVGTKTGTPQKVPTEICLHVELAHWEQHRRQETSCNQACLRGMAGEARPHRDCYSPSMVIFGRRSEAGDASEVMVIVVADDPLVGKFGGDVAGPAAVAILREALGQTRSGREPVPDLIEGFAPSSLAPETGVPETGAQPWAEVGW